MAPRKQPPPSLSHDSHDSTSNKSQAVKKSKKPQETPKKKKRKRKRSYTWLPPFDLYSTKKNVSFEEGFASVIQLLKERNNILVLVGAGISVSCGIPDFRSSRDGLYSTLNTAELGLSCAEDLFDYDVFVQDPRPFYKFAKSLYFPLGNDKELQPSCSHKFLALLEQHEKLLRVYTQNIDGLEQVAGVSPEKVVYAHGSLQCLTCCKCQNQVPVNSAIKQDILRGNVPKCQEPACIPRNGVNSRHFTRSSSVESEDSVITTTTKRYCNGVLKPNVVFFGQTLDNSVGKRLEADYSKADALVVIGTSLSVAPMSKVISYLKPDIPRILLNRTMVCPPPQGSSSNTNEEEQDDFRKDLYVFDAYLLGFCDDVTRALVKELFEGNEKDHNKEKKLSLTNGSPACESTTVAANSGDNSCKGQVLAALDLDDEDEDMYNYQKWKETNNKDKIPPERVFLFPGATLMQDSEEEVVEYQEVAHCDGCFQKIPLDQCIYKCRLCFDYDLCPQCYPKESKIHNTNGTHVFVTEQQRKEPVK